MAAFFADEDPIDVQTVHRANQVWPGALQLRANFIPLAMSKEMF